MGRTGKIAGSSKFSAKRLLAAVLVFAASFSALLLYRWLLASQEETPTTTAPPLYTWPAQGELTSRYGWRWGRMHKGIDIAAPIGTPVVASASGTVTYAQWNDGGYGNLVEITHPDGTTTLYGHNDRLLVSEGQEVEQNQQIAEMGTTGRSNGPHLHFEICPEGEGADNPMKYLPQK